MGWHRIHRDDEIESTYEACSLDHIIGAGQHTDVVLIVGQCRAALEYMERHPRYCSQRYEYGEWQRAARMLPLPSSPHKTYSKAPMPWEDRRRHVQIRD